MSRKGKNAVRNYGKGMAEYIDNAKSHYTKKEDLNRKEMRKLDSQSKKFRWDKVEGYE